MLLALCIPLKSHDMRCGWSPFRHEGGKSAAIEEMLTDICKYCPCQGWMELSYEVYEMLAESQRELGLKEDYLQTVVQLLGLCEGKPLPDGFSAQKWMNQLMELSNMPRGGKQSWLWED